MNFKVYIPFLFVIFISCNQKECSTQYPSPTNTIIKYDMEDGSTKNLKKDWLNKIHQAEEGTDWRLIEKRNMLSKFKKKRDFDKSGGKEVIVEGVVEGNWIERGSTNQAGNVLATAYNKYTDELYTISASGIIWKGDALGNNWKPQNEFLRFDNQFLACFPTDSTDRLVSSVKGTPFFSDDKGLTWTQASGIPVNGNQAIRRWVKPDSSNHIFVLHKSSYWDNYKLYISKDRGESYSLLTSFQTSDENNIALTSPHHSDDFYLIEQIQANTSRILKWQDSIQNVNIINNNVPFAFGGSGRANLISSSTDSLPIMYSYNENNEFYKSMDEGASWEHLSTLPSTPWSVGVFISKSNQDNLIYGEVNAYRSLDGGQNWYLINEWWEYYQDPVRKLHADIMYINEFETLEGEPFILISNHGGINRTDDGTLTNYNISTENLNVSQYYDVRTFPFDHNYVFAGSQDQGFQRGMINITDSSAVQLEQVISGDYGHIEFTQGGLGMWMVYPGGWVTFYGSPIWGEIDASYELISENESVWIPPIVPSPNTLEHAVYMAGGNINGGSGSYLLKLSYDQVNGITATQSDYNFQNSGDIIASIAFNHFDPSTIYVAGQNGRFFISEDGGQNFERISINVPNAHYLYGNCIYPSKLDPEVIYISGSGYSNPAVIKSIDGGLSFEAMNNGLPSTLVFNIVGNQDESLFFAATESGPYVYVVEHDQWYDLSGTSAPSNTYWSVEFLDEENIARYGTYGRGIWDFNLDEQIISSSNELDMIKNIVVYPNPTSDLISWDRNLNVEQIIIFDQLGKLAIKTSIKDNKLNVSHLKSGLYYALLESKSVKYQSKVVIIR